MNTLPNKIKNLNKSKKSFLVPKFLVFDVEMFEKNSDLVFKKVRKVLGKIKLQLDPHVVMKTIQHQMQENIIVN